MHHLEALEGDDSSVDFEVKENVTLSLKWR